jgi:hypothetical protein
VTGAWLQTGWRCFQSGPQRPSQALDFEVLAMNSWVPAAIPAFFAFAVVGYGLLQAYG